MSRRITANIDRWFLRITVIYALVAMVLGIVMGISEDHAQTPTHAHLNLVGWVSMALYALVYRQYPAAAESRFAIPALLGRHHRRSAADRRRLHSDGAHALAGIRRDLWFLNHDPWHANVRRHRVFEGLAGC